MDPTIALKQGIIWAINLEKPKDSFKALLNELLYCNKAFLPPKMKKEILNWFYNKPLPKMNKCKT